jgi:hypothetical protein
MTAAAPVADDFRRETEPLATRRQSALSRTSVRILLLLLAAMAALLYVEWRSVRAAPGPASESDTMCFAARVGLSCRS